MSTNHQTASINCNAKVRGPVRTQWPPAWLRERHREPDAADRRTDPSPESKPRAALPSGEPHEPDSLLRAELPPPDRLANCEGGPDELPPVEPDPLDDAAWFDELAQTASDAPGGRWEDCPEWPEPCPSCGRVLPWWDLAGGVRCLICDPPNKAERFARLAAQLRVRYGKPHPPGAAELLAGFDEARRLRREAGQAGRVGPESD